MQYYYLNGEIIPAEKTKIHVSDIGLIRGYAVFDFLRTYNGKPFFLEEHIKRLENSAKLLGLTVPISRDELKQLIIKLIEKNGFRESTARIILTGGITLDGKTFNPDTPTLCVRVDQLRGFPKEVYENGVSLISLNWKRPLPKAKTIDYIMAIRTLTFANKKRKKKIFEVLYTPDNCVLEASTSNFFLFKKDVLITPKDDILPGVTRAVVLRLAKKKFKVEERKVFKDELKEATEAFITSTEKEIIPVIKIDNLVIGDGTIGNNTKLIMQLFRDFVQSWS